MTEAVALTNALSGFETAVLCILGVLTLLVAIDKGVDAFNHLFVKRRAEHEESQSDKINKIEDRLTLHERRLNRGDAKFDGLSEDMMQMLNVLNAILMHEITGNGVETLKSVKSELDAYMASRK